MNEIRSWDSNGRDISRFEVYPEVPMRIVAWPEGAPSQDSVPHAGEVKLWSGKKVMISSGIPFLRVPKSWVLECREVGSTNNWWVKVEDLLDPPKPENTYTEEEIREAMKREIDLGTYYEDKVMDRLQKK